MSISLESYESLFKAICQKACKLLKQKQNHRATIILGKGHNLSITGIDEEDGKIIAEVAVPIARSSGADYVFFISEAWSAPYNSCAPSKNPSRKEVLIVSAEHIEHGPRINQFEIIRSEKGKIISTTEVKCDFDQIGGNLANMLSKDSPTNEAFESIRYPGYKSNFKVGGYTLH